MICPFHRTSERGYFADRVGSGDEALWNCADGMGFVGWLAYRLTETIPAA